jgi:hypothetical protein
VLRDIAVVKEHRHAVSFAKLRNVLDKRALLSMVVRNLMALRRKSAWAGDLPEAVFPVLKDEKLVTMPSPPELYFVLKIYEDGQARCSKEYFKNEKGSDFFSAS